LENRRGLKMEKMVDLKLFVANRDPSLRFGISEKADF
jgi:hypothetical protein